MNNRQLHQLIASICVMSMPCALVAQIGINPKSDLEKIGPGKTVFQNVLTGKLRGEGTYVFKDMSHLYYSRHFGDHPGLYSTYFIAGDFSDVKKAKERINFFLNLVLNKKDAAAVALRVEKESFSDSSTKLSIDDDVYSEFTFEFDNNEFGMHLTIFYVYPA